MIAGAGADAVLPTTSRGRLFVAATLAVAFGVRAAAVLADRSTYQPLTDALNFDLIASSMANGHGFGPAVVPPAVGASAFRAPGYPAALAAVYKVFGDHAWTAGRLATQAMGVAVVALIGLITAQLLGRRAGAAALVIAAVYPTLILYGTSLQIEPMLVALELGAIAALLQHRRAPRGLVWPAVAGACIGAAALTREAGFLLLPSAVALVWVGRPRWERRSLAPVAVLLVVAAAVVLPWTVRNYRTFDAFVPVSTSTGYALAGTYNDSAMHNEVDPALWVPPPYDPQLAARLAALPDHDEVSLDTALRKAAIDYIKDHPGTVPKSSFWNTVRLFDLQGPAHAVWYAQFLPYSQRLTRIAVYSSYLVDALAIAAIATGLLRKIPKALWLFPLLVYVNLATLAGNIRYRAALEPFIVLAAAALVAQLWERRAASGGDAGHGDQGVAEGQLDPVE